MRPWQRNVPMFLQIITQYSLVITVASHFWQPVLGQAVPLAPAEGQT